MILLLGANTYIGQAFARALRLRKESFIPLSRSALDYARFDFLFDYVRKVQPELVINAEENAPWLDPEKNVVPGTHASATASYEPPKTPDEETDVSGRARMEMLEANTLLPQSIARVCSMTNIPWGHISSGSIYCGAKVFRNGEERLEKDLSSPAVLRYCSQWPDRVRGFSELDEPNFSFKSPPCTFYSGTKALAEESIKYYPQNYTWRFCLPFGPRDEKRNFLSQLRDGFRMHDALNSFSQVDDCATACLELWERRAPFGVYNVVNPGSLRTEEIIRKIQRVLKPSRRFELLVYQGEASHEAATAYPDSILDHRKLLNAGVKLPDAEAALDRALEKWEPHRATAKQFA